MNVRDVHAQPNAWIEVVADDRGGNGTVAILVCGIVNFGALLLKGSGMRELFRRWRHENLRCFHHGRRWNCRPHKDRRPKRLE